VIPQVRDSEAPVPPNPLLPAAPPITLRAPCLAPSNTVITLVYGSEEIVSALAKQAYIDNGSPASWGKQTLGAARDEFLSDTATVAKAIAEVWTVITGLYPTQRDEILDEIRTPGEIRDEYLFAFGRGQRGLAAATGRLMADFPSDWERRLRVAVSKFNWTKDAAEWNGNAVIHGADRNGNPTHRVNNTGPAIEDLAERLYQAANQQPSINNTK
jgi:DNA sulfur modification protein DndB